MAYGIAEEERAADGVVFQPDLVLQAIRYQLFSTSAIDRHNGVGDIHVHKS